MDSIDGGLPSKKKQVSTAATNLVLPMIIGLQQRTAKHHDLNNHSFGRQLWRQ